MNVTFSGKWAVDSSTFGVAFQATVDGAPIRCVVTTEALQDIDPSNRVSTSEQQFLANQYALQKVAEKLIQAGRIANGQLLITSADVRA